MGGREADPPFLIEPKRHPGGSDALEKRRTDMRNNADEYLARLEGLGETLTFLLNEAREALKAERARNAQETEHLASGMRTAQSEVAHLRNRLSDPRHGMSEAEVARLSGEARRRAGRPLPSTKGDGSGAKVAPGKAKR